MGEIDVANLYSRLGAIEQEGRNRAQREKETSRQNAEMAKLLSHVANTMPQQAEIKKILVALHGEPDQPGDRRGILGRLERLEADKTNVKRAALAAVGLPPFLAAVIEVAKFIIGKHAG